MDESSIFLDRVQLVTALYDLDREVLDGRSFSTYTSWLSETLKLFPDTIVFHDSSLDISVFSEFSNVKFVSYDFKDLPLYRFRERISILNKSEVYRDKSDLVYNCIDYGILINSKLEFLQYASEITRAEGYLWVDAGISRFNPRKLPARFEIPNFALLFDVRNYLRLGLKYKSFKLAKIAPFGSSTRIIGAVTIYIPAKAVAFLSDEYRDFVTGNLDKGFWDTEQVFLAHFSRINPTNYIFQVSGYVAQMIKPKRSINFMVSQFLSRFIRASL